MLLHLAFYQFTHLLATTLFYADGMLRNIFVEMDGPTVFEDSGRTPTYNYHFIPVHDQNRTTAASPNTI